VQKFFEVNYELKMTVDNNKIIDEIVIHVRYIVGHFLSGCVHADANIMGTGGLVPKFLIWDH